MMQHYSVMLEETITSLNVQPNGIYVDGTLGRGGHSNALISRLTTGHLYAFDKDMQAIQECQAKFQNEPRITILHQDFHHIVPTLQTLGVVGVDGIMLDLGVSSPQFDDPKRGFSYRFDARLDMRMNQQQQLDAYMVVNTYSIARLIQIFQEYGEERYAKSIGFAIEKARKQNPIETTFQLVEVIKSALPQKVLRQKGHPAKQVFQALRIEVNDELNTLSATVEECLTFLNVHGRFAIITFHSLEDRIVKNIFQKVCKAPYIDPRIPVKAQDIPQPDFIQITKKPIQASHLELDENHRSHSAKLRVIERQK